MNDVVDPTIGNTLEFLSPARPKIGKRADGSDSEKSVFILSIGSPRFPSSGHTHTHTSIVGWPSFSRARRRRRRYPPPKKQNVGQHKTTSSLLLLLVLQLWFYLYSVSASHMSVNELSWIQKECVCWMERDFPGLPPQRAPSFDFNETNLLIELLAFVFHNRHSCLIGKMYNSFGRNQQSKVGFEFEFLLVWLIFTSATPQSRSG